MKILSFFSSKSTVKANSLPYHLLAKVMKEIANFNILIDGLIKINFHPEFLLEIPIYLFFPFIS